MMEPALYSGEVVHVRVTPVHHRLRYRVFSVLVDPAKLDALDKKLRLFSLNRFNLVSIYPKDYGDGVNLNHHLSKLAAPVAGRHRVDRFWMLTYPRILGYAFNPLTVYFGLDTHGVTRVMIYEVNNTFGERQTYCLPVPDTEHGQPISQQCAKEMYVSPFNAVEGQYHFNITPPGEDLTVGVALKINSKPVIRTHFRATSQPLTDRTLVRAIATTGWMTAKVIAGIHWEAARLWLKGLTIRSRPQHPTCSEQQHHANCSVD